MDYEIKLPRLIGGRDAARDVTAGALPGHLHGDRVLVICRDLFAATPSFADELVRQVLVEREADELVLVGASGEFPGWVSDAAVRRQVASRVRELSLAGHAAS